MTLVVGHSASWSRHSMFKSIQATSIINTRRDFRGDLSLLLATLRGFDLSNDIFDQSVYLDAHGGYCDVFTAKSKRHGNMTVAVKRLRVHILRNEEASKMILRELRIWSSLHHPNVLPLLGYVMQGSYPAFVSQWMVKGSLRNYLEKSTDIPLVHLARGIADGLLYLHNQGVVHSDLKSDNILMSDSFSPLLADFGISRLMTSSSSTSSTTGAKGSARWMAFELLSPRMNGASGKHTKESDVWAYGMVIYELLTGHVPYMDLKNDLQVSVAIAGGQLPAMPDNLDEENKKHLWWICQKCWRSFPKKRPGIGRILSKLPHDSGIRKRSIPFPISTQTDLPSLLHCQQSQLVLINEKRKPLKESETRVVCPVPSCRATLVGECIQDHLASHMHKSLRLASVSQYERIDDQHQEVLYFCDHCGRGFSCQSKLNRHFAVNPYTGLFCRTRSYI
ncbi:kinase-like protein [Schizopora paradoxa]|uniref:Kinase-like protein n=1 Tax=Schizopora paradoxa TaxID=27342 RepID=A0A0H2S426_9AGAM|nr:kinase-like protein [Schizopora paradoxa]